MKFDFCHSDQYEIHTPLSFKHTCALIATSNESAQWPIWDPYRFEFHFASIHVNTNKELTEHRSEIFNRNEILYRFEFILPLTWTYSYKHTVIFLHFFQRKHKLLSTILITSDGILKIIKKLGANIWYAHDMISILMIKNRDVSHCVKSVQIRSYF